jgi:hypothetical protein
VVDALIRPAELSSSTACRGSAYEDDGLVFVGENGTPLRPEYVLRRFYELSGAAALPRGCRG